MNSINIGKQFSRHPAGRTIAIDGDDSGEAFRERYLKPALSSLLVGQKLAIILDDGVISIGSSFISEAFGGLVRERFMTADELKSRLEFVHNKNSRYMRIVAGNIIRNIEENAQL